MFHSNPLLSGSAITLGEIPSLATVCDCEPFRFSFRDCSHRG